MKASLSVGMRSSLAGVVTVIGIGASLAGGSSGCSNVVEGVGGAGTTSTTTGTHMTTTTTGTTTSTTTSTTGTGSAMTPCGNGSCTSTQYCQDSSGLCGKGPAASLSCLEKGNVCSDGQPVCGCDGTVYMSDGCAGLAGVNIDVNGHCPPQPGMLLCGGTYCLGSTYCQIEAHPDSGLPTTYSCELLPPACQTPVTCGCLPNCGSGPQPPPCTIDTDGHATQHCSTG